jgi:hypothetical protein
MSTDLSRGPYVQAAVLCDHVVPEKGGRVTIVGLMDRVVVRSAEASSGTQIGPTTVSCHAVVILKTGSRPGNYKLRLVLKSPSRKKLREFSVDVTLPNEEDHGINVVMPIRFSASEEGVYWFEVRLDDEPLTKTSLRLVRPR